MMNDAQIDEAATAGYRAADGARIPKRFAEDPILSDAWHVGRNRAKEAQRLRAMHHMCDDCEASFTSKQLVDGELPPHSFCGRPCGKRAK